MSAAARQCARLCPLTGPLFMLGYARVCRCLVSHTHTHTHTVVSTCCRASCPTALTTPAAVCHVEMRRTGTALFRRPASFAVRLQTKLICSTHDSVLWSFVATVCSDYVFFEGKVRPVYLHTRGAETSSRLIHRLSLFFHNGKATFHRLQLRK